MDSWQYNTVDAVQGIKMDLFDVVYTSFIFEEPVIDRWLKKKEESNAKEFAISPQESINHSNDCSDHQQKRAWEWVQPILF